MQNIKHEMKHVPYVKPTTKEAPFDKNFLVLLNNLYEVEPMMEIAAALAKVHRGRITAQSLVFLHRLMPLSEGYRFAERCRVYLQIARQYETPNSPVCPLLSITHNLRQTICNTIKKRNVEFVIGGFQGCADIYRNLWHTLSCIPADTLLLRPHPYKNMSDYKRILLTLVNGHHTPIAVEIAFDLAESFGQKLTIISELEGEAEIWMRISRRLATCSGSLSAERIVIKENSFVSSILRGMEKDTLLILPATQPWWPRFQLLRKQKGSLLEDIIQCSETPIIIVKKHECKTGLLRKFLNYSN